MKRRPLLGFYGYLFAIAVIAGMLGGCRHVAYEAPDGTRLTIAVVGFDTTIGRLSAAAGPSTRAVEIEGFDSRAKAIEVLGELAK